jgi:hypothetical protein
MAGVTADTVSKELTHRNLDRHRIIRVPKRRVDCLAVYLLNVSNNGMIAEYRVRIGEFRVYVKVLNLRLKSKFEDFPFGRGAFSTILEKSVVMQTFVVKLQKRYIDRKNIEDVVRETAINKLCSLLEIGPAIETSIPFDIVVSTDAVQFHLEKCEKYSNKLLRKHGRQFERDLKECLRVLHRIGIVHRDIKP